MRCPREALLSFLAGQLVFQLLCSAECGWRGRSRPPEGKSVSCLSATAFPALCCCVNKLQCLRGSITSHGRLYGHGTEWLIRWKMYVKEKVRTGNIRVRHLPSSSNPAWLWRCYVGNRPPLANLWQIITARSRARKQEIQDVSSMWGLIHRWRRSASCHWKKRVCIDWDQLNTSYQWNKVVLWINRILVEEKTEMIKFVLFILYAAGLFLIFL